MWLLGPLLIVIPACAAQGPGAQPRHNLLPAIQHPLSVGLSDDLRNAASLEFTPGPWERVWTVVAPADRQESGDDARPIQAAVDSAGAAGGGLVLLSEGVFRLATTIELSHDNVYVRGAGIGRTTLVIGRAQNTAAILAAGHAPSGFVRNIRVSDLTIDGNRQENSRHYAGIFLQRVQGGSVERVEAMRSTDLGLGFGDASIPGPTSRDILVIACWAHENGGNGFDAANVTRMTFVGNRSDRNGLAGIGVGFFTGHGSTSDVTYLENVALANAGAAFQATSGRYDAEDRYTRGIRYLHNVALGSLPSAASEGNAFLLNRGGLGPTAMEGPYEFVGNRSACNRREGITTYGGVTGVLDRDNTFGFRHQCDSGATASPAERTRLSPSRSTRTGGD